MWGGETLASFFQPASLSSIPSSQNTRELCNFAFVFVSLRMKYRLLFPQQYSGEVEKKNHIDDFCILFHDVKFCSQEGVFFERSASAFDDFENIFFEFVAGL